jgi:hypothetical protein
VRPLRVALAACVLFAAPAPLLAQSTGQQPPNVRPIPPVRRPHPMPTGGFRPNGQRANRFPIVIDGSLMDQYLTTQGSVPPRKAKPRANYHGQDVFETHSTDDAK